MRRRAALLAAIAALAPSAGLSCSAAADGEHRPESFVFFRLERDRIRERSFLACDAIAGAQLTYTWRELEPARGRYAFEALRADLDLLAAHGKRLFVQVQDVSFVTDVVHVPDYLLEDPAFGGGAARTYRIPGGDDAAAVPEGWIARRWDPAVRARFAALLDALGSAFDGRLEGVNLAETSVEFGESGRLFPAGFTTDGYLDAVLEIMSAARAAFTRSHVLVYANFMPGEWLPWTDRGYLRRVHAHAEAIGAGVGGPDLLPFRRGQLAHSYPLIAARAPGIVAGVAVQDGNLAAVDPETGARITVEALLAFAEHELRLDYIFWGTEEPYYSRDVLPALCRLAAGAGAR